MKAKLEADLATAIQGKVVKVKGTNFRDTDKTELAACLPQPFPSHPKVPCPCFVCLVCFFLEEHLLFSSLFSFTCSDHRARESEKIWGHISLPRSSAGVIADSLLLRPHSRGGGQARSQPTQHLLQFDSVIIVSLLV